MLWAGVKHVAVVVRVWVNLQRIHVSHFNFLLSGKNKRVYVCTLPVGELSLLCTRLDRWLWGIFGPSETSSMSASQQSIGIISGLLLMSGNDNLLFFTTLLFLVMCAFYFPD